MKINEYIELMKNGGFDDIFEKLYGKDKSVTAMQKERYENAVMEFAKQFPDRDDISVFSAPGRSEVGGNHTDHQHGCVIAAAVNLDIIAIVAFHNDGVIRLQSKGYPIDIVELENLEPSETEYGKSSALIRGVVSRFKDMGVNVGGFDAYTTSDVLGGSGLSSSAAFEVLIGTIIDLNYNNGRAGAVEIAKIGQYAENVFFGKKSGLMDQMVSSVGSFVYTDFEDTENPKIEKLYSKFEDAGYCLCITDTKGSHADLTPDYVSVPDEMNEIAAKFGKEYLRQVDENDFYNALPELRKTCSDRAVLRAAHFFSENKRAGLEAEALSKNDINEFLRLVNESGNSSARWLQNVYSPRKPEQQGISLGILASERMLCGKGAARVHGGGFAGTVQAFVPVKMLDAYKTEMDRIFGDGSCQALRIRPVGGIKIA